jgi:hypothetical protein
MASKSGSSEAEPKLSLLQILWGTAKVIWRPAFWEATRKRAWLENLRDPEPDPDASWGWDVPRERAEERFKQYLAEKDPCIEQLLERMEKEDPERFPRSRFDFSIDSLVPLWAYFLEHMELEKRPRKDPNPFRDPPFRKKQFTRDTVWLQVRIAYYFGDVLVKNLPGSIWALGDAPFERYADQNTPVIRFPHKLEVNPHAVIYPMAMNAAQARWTNLDKPRPYHTTPASVIEMKRRDNTPEGLRYRYFQCKKEYEEEYDEAKALAEDEEFAGDDDD